MTTAVLVVVVAVALWLRCCSAIPRYNKEEIDKDIDGVKTWIDDTKEELWSKVGNVPDF